MKPLSHLLQSLFAVTVVGYGNLGLMILKSPNAFLVWHHYNEFLVSWFIVFIILALCRTAIAMYLTRGVATSMLKKPNLLSEISLTLQYLFLTLVSIFGSFELYIMRLPGGDVHINQRELWLGIEPSFTSWFIGVLILSLFRLGFLYVFTKRG